MSKLRFRPTYNPYTEPSMEILGKHIVSFSKRLLHIFLGVISYIILHVISYHGGFGKWLEVGNSSMFRLEMLLPMVLPVDVRIVAWGLSLKR